MRLGFDRWVRKVPWSRKWQPTPVFLTGKSHGHRSLAGCSPWNRKRVEHDLRTKQQQTPQRAFIVCFLHSIILQVSDDFINFVNSWTISLSISSCSLRILFCLDRRLIYYSKTISFFLLTPCLPFLCACLDFDCILLQDK